MLISATVLEKGLGCSLPNRPNWTQLSIGTMIVPVPLLK
jgi:hypothetical protein